MYQPRIGYHVDDFRAVPQVVQFVQREEAHAGVIRFGAQHAIQFDGMADRFVDLQPELRAVENEIEHAFWTLIGGVERHGLFGDTRRVFEQPHLIDQLIAFQLVLPAERVRV